MKQQYVINSKSFVKSNIDPFKYFVLQMLYEKDTDMFDHMCIKLTEQFASIIVWLCDEEYIRYAGFREGDVSTIDIINEIINENLELGDFVLLDKAKSLFEQDELSAKINDVSNWIEDYRKRFKGIKNNAMGDSKACIKKMQVFMKNNPKYSKEDILRATDNYIKETVPMYVKQADYFIYKTGNDNIAVSSLGMYCERLGNKVVPDKSLNEMI